MTDNDVRTIWKFVLDPYGDTLMPEGARIIEAAEQAGQVCVWAIVDPKRPLVPRTLRVVGTGHEFVPADDVYVGTVHLRQMGLVFHVFDGGES